MTLLPVILVVPPSLAFAALPPGPPSSWTAQSPELRASRKADVLPAPNRGIDQPIVRRVIPYFDKYENLHTRPVFYVGDTPMVGDRLLIALGRTDIAAERRSAESEATGLRTGGLLFLLGTLGAAASVNQSAKAEVGIAGVAISAFLLTLGSLSSVAAQPPSDAQLEILAARHNRLIDNKPASPAP